MNIYKNCQCTSITRRIVKRRETEMETPPQKEANAQTNSCQIFHVTVLLTKTLRNFGRGRAFK
jgi:hypothetical protein